MEVEANNEIEQRYKEIENLCVQKGFKVTGQRRVIIKSLIRADDHPDVEQIHKRASDVDNKISIATVYRTMRLLDEMGIVKRHDFGDGRARYEHDNDEHHDHLIDMRSGKIIEFFDEEIEILKEKIANRLGYKLIDHRLELYCIPLEE